MSDFVGFSVLFALFIVGVITGVIGVKNSNFYHKAEVAIEKCESTISRDKHCILTAKVED